MISLIGYSLWDKLKNNYFLTSTEIRASNVNGDKLPLIGRVKLPIKINQVQLEQTFYIGDIQQQCILGCDFLKENKGEISFKENALILNKTVTPFVAHVGNDSCSLITLAHKVTLKVDEEVIVDAATTGPEKEEGVVKPNQNFTNKYGLLVARILVKRERGQIPVRLLNTSGRIVQLKKGTSIGIFENGVAQISSINDTSSSTKELLAAFPLGDTNLSINQKEVVYKLLFDFADIFSKNSNDIGHTDKIYHSIDTGEAIPLRQAPRRIPLHKRPEAEKILEDMLEKEVIQESSSPWCSPVVLVAKKDGTQRFCIDYRKLNNITKKDAYPLPRIDETLDCLANCQYFTTLDLTSGYWQVEMNPKDREKTAFSMGGALYEFKVLPFGLCNAPATFQRLMNLVLRGLNWKICMVYLDDVIIFSHSFEEHLERLQKVFSCLREAGLKLKPKKCTLFQQKVKFLGHVVSKEGVATDPEKNKSVENWPTPKSVEDVRSFLGTASYYRRFIQNFSNIAAPLNKLLQKGEKFAWSRECDIAFLHLKKSLCSAPVLAFPNPKLTFILDTDASCVGLGAVLSQIQGGEERAISFMSRTMNKAEKNYSVTKKEMLALVSGIRHYRHYLCGAHFIVRTDHNALKWLQNFKEPEGQVARWLELLSDYDFTVEYRPGKKHCNADGLSRQSKLVNSIEIGECCDVTIGDAQKSDNGIKLVLEWLLAGSRPSYEEVKALGQEVCTLWSQWDSLTIVDNVVYRKWEGDGIKNTIMQAILPLDLRAKVWREFHELPMGGHLGYYKTLAKFRDRFYWPGMSKDVLVMCKACIGCQERKMPVGKRKAPLGFVPVGEPFQVVQVDLIGPLPRTERNNRYILVVTDVFTKWVEAYPLKNIEARSVAGTLLAEFISRFGAPREIHTDQGRQFESTLFQELCSLLGISKTRSTPYHPQSNGQVERFNRTLLAMLSQYVKDKQEEWDLFLPLVMLAYRSSCHESTQFSPHYLLFGREIRLPVDLQYATPPGLIRCKEEAIMKLQRNILNAHSYVRTNIKTEHLRQKQYYDRGCPERDATYQVGDLVWVFEKIAKLGVCTKLTRPWKGPFRVIKKLSDTVVRIQSLDNNLKKRTRMVIHIDRLKPYKSGSDTKRGTEDKKESRDGDKEKENKVNESGVTVVGFGVEEKLQTEKIGSNETEQFYDALEVLELEPAESQQLDQVQDGQQQTGGLQESPCTEQHPVEVPSVPEAIASVPDTSVPETIAVNEPGPATEHCTVAKPPESPRYPQRARKQPIRYQAGEKRYPSRTRKPPDRYQDNW